MPRRWKGKDQEVEKAISLGLTVLGTLALLMASAGIYAILATFRRTWFPPGFTAQGVRLSNRPDPGRKSRGIPSRSDFCFSREKSG